MHIGLVDFNFFEYTISLANALSPHAQVTVLVPDEFQAVRNALSPDIQVVRFAKPRLRSPANLKMLSQISGALDRLRPDVVHLLAVNPWFNAGLLLQRPRRLVTTIHDPEKHAGDASQSNVPQYARDLPIRYSRRLIVHGQALKKAMLKRHRLAPDQVVVIPHGELSIYRHWSRTDYAERDGTVLFFGRVWPYKGLDYLIAAEPAISAACPNVRFVIAGMGEDFERYRKLMAHPERFEVLNRRIPNEEVPRLFQEASIVALPYTEASQTGVVPVAYGFGKPVVATTVGSIPEVVDDGKTGLLVPPRDSEALAQALIALLRDKDMRRQMGHCALEKAQGELSWTAIAAQTLEVYRQALE